MKCIDCQKENPFAFFTYDYDYDFERKFPIYICRECVLNMSKTIAEFDKRRIEKQKLEEPF